MDDLSWLSWSFMDFHGPGRHLLIFDDATIATLYRKYMLASDRFNTPGLGAMEAEQRKFDDDRSSSLPTSLGHHRLVPFAVEEAGSCHALALLRELAARGVRDGFLQPPSSWLVCKRARLIS